MAKSDFTAEVVRFLMRYDQSTGKLYWKYIGRRHKPGDEAGSVDKSHGYRRVRVCKFSTYVHRLVWLHATGEWPKHHIDHINGDRDDNRIENLRDVPASVNMQNLRAPMSSNKTSGLLGVSLIKGTDKYVARMRVPGKYLSLGRFSTAEEAHAAYVKAKRELHEGCTI